MSQITTHILDTSLGQPAAAVKLTLSVLNGEQWLIVAEGRTNDDGRVLDLVKASEALAAGTYQLHFDTASYFTSQQKTVFYPWVDVVFNLNGDGAHYHIPLLLNPFGYSTYRGS